MSVDHSFQFMPSCQEILALLDRVNRGGLCDCWEWQGHTTPRGYGKLELRRKQMYVHVAVYLYAFGPIPPAMEVCHDCDNPRCVNPSHLFIGSHSENMKDCFRKGRARSTFTSVSTRGERNVKAKLNAAQVASMRDEYVQGGITKASLGRKYGVTAVMAGLILNNHCWTAP